MMIADSTHGIIPSSGHWADWRLSGTGRRHDDDMAGAFSLSKDAMAFLKELAHAAIHGEEASFSVENLTPEDRQCVAAYLGHGACAVYLMHDPAIQLTETSFSGIWRVSRTEGDSQDARLASFTVGSLPLPALDALREHALTTGLPDDNAFPPSLDSMAQSTITTILNAIRQWNIDEIPQGINLSHIPYSPRAQREIIDWLSQGVVRVETTGSFVCHVQASRYYPAWYCVYKDSSHRPKSATIEIVPIPECVAVPHDDVAASGKRILADALGYDIHLVQNTI